MKKGVFFAHAGIVGLFLFSMLLLACEESKETIKPRLMDMTVSVYASLIVQPEDLHDLYAEVPGVIQSIKVEEGDTVVKNQVLAMIERENISFDVNTAEINQALAEKNLKGQSTKLSTIKSELSNLSSQLQLDSMNFIRQQNLWKQNIGSKNQLDLYELKYKQGQENLVAAQHRFDQLKQDLEANYLLTKNKLKQIRSVSSNYLIKSKIAGRIYTLYKDIGEAISIQEPLAQIGSTSQFVVEMQIDEVDIASIRHGQKVMMSLDAYPDDIFDGSLTKILPSKNLRTQTFTAEAKFNNPPTSLYAGLAGEANIIISTEKSALTIPLDYIAGDNAVLDENGNRIKVVLGEKNMNMVRIISGIDSTTVIMKPSVL